MGGCFQSDNSARLQGTIIIIKNTFIIIILKVTVGSATPAIFMSILLFILPQVTSPSKHLTHSLTQTYDFWPFTSMNNSLKNSPSLITWRLIETKMCWGVIFLLGGGFALAKVLQTS